MNRSTWIAIVGVFGAALTFPAFAQNVKVTPLGGIDGEFCPQDRALIFEDANGTRSKTEAFVKASKVPVVIPLLGKTMEFDAGGKCTAGC